MFFEARNQFEAQAAKDGVVEASGSLTTIAVSRTIRELAREQRLLDDDRLDALLDPRGMTAPGDSNNSAGAQELHDA